MSGMMKHTPMKQSDHLPLQSLDIVSASVERIFALFPNCVTEGPDGKVIDFDLLRQELSRNIIDGPKERYRLEWPGKRQAIVTANLPTTKTLRPVREESVDFDTTQNLYIEGDNLEVLKILQESYLGKVKMIYIDPPYNTGKDFVYRDNFTQKTDEYLEESGQKDEYGQRMVVNPDSSGRYHSDWLSMMYPRLKLARNLLTDDGVIFISIDDIEASNLHKLCDEIFGQGNFVATIVWQKKYSVSADDPGIAAMHDYILCYSKTSEFQRLLLPRTEKQISRYKNPDGDSRGPWSSDNYVSNKSKEERSTLWYPIKHPKTGTDVWPDESAVWRYSAESHDRMVAENRLFWGPEDSYEKPRLKRFLFEIQEGIVPSTWWTFDEVGHNDEGQKETARLIGKKIFSTPKPVRLLDRIISISTEKDDIVLDFYSGSASTAHAVFQKNTSDKERRKFILVQVPELTETKSEAFKSGYRNICEIGKERIQRAAKKIKEELAVEIVQNQSKIKAYEKAKAEGSALNAEKIEEKIDECRQVITENQKKLNTVDFGFRVYRLAESNMQDVYHRPQDFKQEQLDAFADNVKPDRTADDLLAQVMLAWGLPLSLKIEQATIKGKQVFRVAGNSLLACFDAGIDEAFAKEAAKEKPLRIIFRDSGFANDTAKVNVRQLLKQLSPETEMRVI
jgi:adenine-specific DNA-methyltransferase